MWDHLVRSSLCSGERKNVLDWRLGIQVCFAIVRETRRQNTLEIGEIARDLGMGP